MKNKTILIGIAGASCSGKTLLAKTLVKEIACSKVVIIGEDAYYLDRSHLPFEEREKINYDHPDAFDHKLLYEHLLQLKQGKTVNIPVYDYALHARSNKTQQIDHYNIVVLEGILLFSDPALRDILDIRIFVDAPLDTCLIRRIKRDIIERDRSIDSILAQYEMTVRPMYLQFIEPSKHHADIIVPKGGENRIAIDLVKAKMKELLSDFA